MSESNVRDETSGGLDVLGMPETEDETRGEEGFVVRVARHDVVHEGEEALGIVVDLDVDIEEDLHILGAHEEGDSLAEGGDLLGDGRRSALRTRGDESVTPTF